MVDETARKLYELMKNGLLNAAESTATMVTGGLKLLSTLLGRAIDKAAQKAGISEYPGQVSLEHLYGCAKHLNAHAKQIVVANEDLQRLKALIDRQEIMYAVLDLPHDSGKVIWYMDKDSATVRDCINTLKANALDYGEVSAKYMGDTADHLKAISGLTDAELELFRASAEIEKPLFATVKTGKNENLILYEARKAEAVARTMAAVGWAMTSERAGEIEKSASRYAEGMTKIKDALNSEKKLVVISKSDPTNYVLITSDGYEYNKGNEIVRSERIGSMDYESRAIADIQSLGDPVIADAEVWSAELSDSVSGLDPLTICPHDYDMASEHIAMSNMLAMISAKWSLDNEGDTPFGRNDSSVSLAEYASREALADIDAETRKMMERDFAHCKKAIEYRRMALTAHDVSIEKGRSLDKIIEKAKRAQADMVNAEKVNTKDKER